MPQRYQPTLAELATAYGLHGTPLYVSQLQAQRADGALVTAYAQWCTDEARSSEGPRQQQLLACVAQHVPAPVPPH